MALGDTHTITLDPSEYRHIGVLGESWLATNHGADDAHYVFSATTTVIDAALVTGSALTRDLSLSGVQLAQLVADGDTVAGHLMLRGSGTVVRHDLADGVTAPA